MEITAITPLPEPEAGGSAYTISLSDGSVCSLKTVFLPPAYRDRILEALHTELPEEAVEAIRFAGVCFDAEVVALRLAARAEQTRLGLTAKLERRGYNAAAVRAVVSRLSELGILSDRRYAELWLQDRLARKAETPRRLSAALYGRGIDRKAVAEALKAALDFETELGLAKAYREKIPPGTALKRLLKQEGFSSGVIQAVLEESV